MLKRIKTQQDRERDKKKNQIIIGIVLIGLMLLSTLGYSLMDRNKETTASTSSFAGVDFNKVNDYWKATIQNKDFYFNNLPMEVKNVSVVGEYSAGDYLNQVVYFVNNNQEATKIANALDGVATRFQDACVEGIKCENMNLPIKTCNDSVIIFKLDNATKIYRENKCVYLTGDFSKSSDALVYKMLGIL